MNLKSNVSSVLLIFIGLQILLALHEHTTYRYIVQLPLRLYEIGLLLCDAGAIDPIGAHQIGWTAVVTRRRQARCTRQTEQRSTTRQIARCRLAGCQLLRNTPSTAACCDYNQDNPRWNRLKYKKGRTRKRSIGRIYK